MPSIARTTTAALPIAAPPPHWLWRRQELDPGALPVAVLRVLPDPSPQPCAGAQEPAARPAEEPIEGGAKARNATTTNAMIAAPRTMVFAVITDVRCRRFP